MRPLMILAATVAGLARYMDAWLDPIRPGKFRLVLLIQVSPGAMIPSWAPRHAPQPGVVMVAPAFIKSCMYPFSIQESMSLIKNLGGFLLAGSMTGGVGEVSNFILGCLLVIPAGLIANSLVTLLTYGFADMLYSLSDFSFR